MPVSRFNVRVYMLLYDESFTRLMLSDEIVKGEYYTKFPGGGLEYGEGILECLHREAKEELGQEVDVLNQFYTSEIFQTSKFAPEDQLVCVYYQCCLAKNEQGQRLPVFRLSTQKFGFVEKREREESFRWQEIDSLQEEDVSFDLDRKVVKRLLEDARK